VDRVSITATSFLDYALGGQRGRVQVVNAQRSIYQAEELRGRAFYQPVRHALRAEEPEKALAAAVRSATRQGQARAFTEIAEGFLPWLRRQRAVGVPVTSGSWSLGELDLSVRPDLGLRGRDGVTTAVLAYFKEPVLTREVAMIGVRIMQRALGPDVRALVLDTRRGKHFSWTARTNGPSLDALIAGEVAGYVTHWRLAA
jgi:hypothetical protein